MQCKLSGSSVTDRYTEVQDYSLCPADSTDLIFIDIEIVPYLENA